MQHRQAPADVGRAPCSQRQARAPRSDVAIRARASPTAATSSERVDRERPEPDPGRPVTPTVNGTIGPTQPTWAKESARIAVEVQHEHGEAERRGDAVRVVPHDAASSTAAAGHQRAEARSERQQDERGQPAPRAMYQTSCAHRPRRAVPASPRSCGPSRRARPAARRSRGPRASRRAASPSTIAAVLAAFACSASPAATVTVRHGPSAGHAGARVDDVVHRTAAAPPASHRGRPRRQATLAEQHELPVGALALGDLHTQPSGRSPATATSPPSSTSTPVPYRCASVAAARSAACAFAVAPRSSSVPAGTVSRPATRGRVARAASREPRRAARRPGRRRRAR